LSQEMQDPILERLYEVLRAVDGILADLRGESKGEARSEGHAD
jgi:hypothetical protein